METGVRAEKPKCDPSLVDARWRSSLESTNVDGPVCKAGEAKGETTTDGFGHSLEGGFAVTTPLEWELLSTGSCGASEKDSLVATVALLEGFVDNFIEQVGVVVVHFLRVDGFVEPLNILIRDLQVLEV